MKHDRIILQQQLIVAVSEYACSFDQFKFIVVFMNCLNMSLKRKRSSLKDKIDIIEESDKYNLSLRRLAEKFGFGKTQINDIVKNKSDIKRMYEEAIN